MRSSASNVLVAVLTVLALVALTGYQVTGETSAVRLLGRLGAALIEIDRWLPAHQDDIELLARDRPNQPLVLSDLPIEVAIPAGAALDSPVPILEATVTEAMGRRLYDEGYGAIHDEQGASHLGITEPLRWAVDGLDSGAHSFWRVVLAVSGLGLLVVCFAHFWARQTPLPGIAVGGAVSSVLALVIWLAVGAIGSSVSGAIDEEIARVASDSVWIGLRNSLATAAIGLGALYVYNSFVSPRHGNEWEEWDDADFEPYEAESREAPPY